jgi:hypothetical protein
MKWTSCISGHISIKQNAKYGSEETRTLNDIEENGRGREIPLDTHDTHEHKEISAVPKVDSTISKTCRCRTTQIVRGLIKNIWDKILKKRNDKKVSKLQPCRIHGNIS